MTNTTFTIEQIQQHNTAADCYLLINSNVYDVTAYENEHPGGAQRIISYCGKDATIAFQNQGGEGQHSQVANNLLNSFQVGALTTSSAVAVVNDPIDNNGLYALLPGLERYPFVIPTTIVWITIIIVVLLLRQLLPNQLTRPKLLRALSILLFVIFSCLAVGGTILTVYGRFKLFNWNTIQIHAFLGYSLVLVGLTHAVLHRRELWIYVTRWKKSANVQ
ncbi:MAG: cytochrome b5 domain-containing protein [Patescibacteria group bacterium]|jgi:hypothetical protein